MELRLGGGHDVGALTVDLVTHTHRDLLDAGEHVKFGEEDVGGGVDVHRLLDDHGVEPAAPTWPAGGGPELTASLSQCLTTLVEQLGGERPLTHAGGVGLGDADDPVDAGRSDAGAGTRTAGDRTGRGDVGVGAEVDVQVMGLGPLEEDNLVVVKSLVEQTRSVDDVGADPLGVGEQPVDHLIGVNGTSVVDLHQGLVLAAQGGLDLLTQDGLVEEVLHTDADPVDLVGVGRTNSASGGTDPALAQESLSDPVHRLVVGSDDVGVGADEGVGHLDAAPAQGVELVVHDVQVDDDAISEYRGGVGVEDSSGQQVHDEGVVTHDNGVSGVVAPGVPDAVVDSLGYLIGGFSFSLVAPLGSHDDDSGHTLSISSDSWTAGATGPTLRHEGFSHRVSSGSCTRTSSTRPAAPPVLR